MTTALTIHINRLTANGTGIYRVGQLTGYGEIGDNYTIITPGYTCASWHIRSAKRASIYRKKHPPCKGEAKMLYSAKPMVSTRTNTYKKQNN